ncbi:MAG: hypothetical protein A2521_16770 [Deltaproteobacteria bacterium RIFOXYD12_FULL_57_12]|nr:MAG: hypothetical protein A2521_16770 [Deltaproteobacteria bacterium RIFOXYD12_FULL_57_12]
MSEKPYLLNVKFLRRLLIAADDLMHFAVAVILLICAGMVLVKTLPNLLHPDSSAILHVLNDVLLGLIIMELMWPIVRFLKREAFSLNPFIYIGIISSIRRILLLEAEHSMIPRLGSLTADWPSLWPLLAEVGANVGIILVLAVALRILSICPPDEMKEK